MANFIEAYQEVIKNEGVYSFDPNDSGGETLMGISKNNWPKWDGWKIVDTLSSPKEMAINVELQNKVQSFYLQNFWNPIKGDEIHSQVIANSIMDFAVNAGAKTSVRLAQKVVGVKDDGIIGNNTLNALNFFDERLFIAEFKLAKIDRYCDIVDEKPNQLKWLKGWVRRALR
jgi:lysozyme family protein